MKIKFKENVSRENKYLSDALVDSGYENFYCEETGEIFMYHPGADGFIIIRECSDKHTKAGPVFRTTHFVETSYSTCPPTKYFYPIDLKLTAEFSIISL